MLLGISPRGAHSVGVVELRQLLMEHVLSDATKDHVQDLAAMEAVPTAGDLHERVMVAEDAMKDVRGHVQKHAKRLSLPPIRLVPRNERHPWIIHPESTVEEAHSAGIAPAFEHEIAPAQRAPPSAAASSGAAPKSLHQIEPRKYSAVESRIFLPMAVGCSISCHSDEAGRSNTNTSKVRRLAVAR